MRDFLPATPVVEAGQVIRAHDPDEVCRRRARFQTAQQVSRIIHTEPSFDVSDNHAWMGREAGSRGDAGIIAAMALFQGVTARDDPPDPVQVHPAHRGFRNMEMSFMRWIEGTAEQADFQPC